MPRPRFDHLPADRRRHILETAAQEFAAHGFDGASLNNIIERLGISKGSFYYYFDDKADLFGAVLDMVWERFFPTELLDVERLDAKTFWPAIGRMLQSNLEQTLANPWLVGVTRMLRQGQSNAAAQAAIDTRMALARAWQRDLLRRGQEVGVIRRDLPLELLMVLLSAVDDAADGWLLANWEAWPQEEIARMCSVLHAMLRDMLAPLEAGGPERS